MGVLNKTAGNLTLFPSNYGDWEPPACKGITTSATSCKISGPLVGLFSFMHDLQMGAQIFGASAHPGAAAWARTSFPPLSLSLSLRRMAREIYIYRDGVSELSIWE